MQIRPCFHRRVTAGLATLLAAGTLLAGQATAQNRTMCSQPVKPTCVESDITYENQQRIDRCRRDVENYGQSVEDYLACLEDKQRAQREQLEQLRETFRCNANDDVDC